MALLEYLWKKKPDRKDSDEPDSPVFVVAGQSVRLLSLAEPAVALKSRREG